MRLNIDDIYAKYLGALAANERDRTKLAEVVSALDKEIKSRSWLTDNGRGSYEWDDARYQTEFSFAVEAILKCIEPLRKIAADLKDSPTTQAAVELARDNGWYDVNQQAPQEAALYLVYVTRTEEMPTYDLAFYHADEDDPRWTTRLAKRYEGVAVTDWQPLSNPPPTRKKMTLKDVDRMGQSKALKGLLAQYEKVQNTSGILPMNVQEIIQWINQRIAELQKEDT